MLLQDILNNPRDLKDQTNEKFACSLISFLEKTEVFEISDIAKSRLIQTKEIVDLREMPAIIPISRDMWFEWVVPEKWNVDNEIINSTYSRFIKKQGVHFTCDTKPNGWTFFVTIFSQWINEYNQVLGSIQFEVDKKGKLINDNLGMMYNPKAIEYYSSFSDKESAKELVDSLLFMGLEIACLAISSKQNKSV